MDLAQLRPPPISADLRGGDLGSPTFLLSSFRDVLREGRSLNGLLSNARVKEQRVWVGTDAEDQDIEVFWHKGAGTRDQSVGEVRSHCSRSALNV